MSVSWAALVLVVVLLSVPAVAGCGLWPGGRPSLEPTAAATAAPRPTRTGESTAAPSPVVSVDASPSPRPSRQAGLSPTPTPSASAPVMMTAVASATLSPTVSPSTSPPASSTPSPSPSAASPTPTGSPAPATANPTASPLPPTPTRSATASVVPTPAPVPGIRERFGVAAGFGHITAPAVQQLGIGWYLNWTVAAAPARPNGAQFWQMVRVSQGGYRPDAGTIESVARANPGSTWIVGNEPDVIWQDSTTPERYAGLYHELYHLLKGTDPAARVAIAGVSQATPLRLAYLDRVLSAYQQRYGTMIPVDVWNVHGFVLREERGSWGVEIPPGFDVQSGMLYEIDDHDDLAIFRQQLLAFRRWMAAHAQRDKPLVVTEYGILMPADYGFDANAVRAFMEASFDVFLTATDGAVGYPPDGNRLVQWWCWYSLADTTYSTGNLYDPSTQTITPLGWAFANYSPP